MSEVQTGANPTRDDFAALLEESFITHDVVEGAVVKGTIVAIEKDLAVIDVGLKVEGRVALKEFGARAKASSSTRSRAVSLSIWTERSPSCRAARSISGRSAMSPR